MKTRFIVLIVECKKENEEEIYSLIEKFKETVNNKSGKVYCPYKGSERRLISALDSILKLARE